MKNTLTDLNNHLFAQMERLSDEDKKGDDLREEIDRAKSVTALAQAMISNGRLVLDAQIEFGKPTGKSEVAGLLGVSKENG
jgi:hypothetical protein